MTPSFKQMMLNFGLLLVAFISPLNSMTFEDGETISVDTKYGNVRGKSFPSQYHKLPHRWVNVFLGIPYAKRLEQFGGEWREKYRFMVRLSRQKVRQKVTERETESVSMSSSVCVCVCLSLCHSVCESVSVCHCVYVCLKL